MLKYVENFLIENNLLNKKILVGFSGGTDSCCLLDILSKINIPVCLIAVHLNHNWRGIESKEDEDFARNFAAKRNIAFYTETLPYDVKKTETAARELRYDFFARMKEKFEADAVFLAHNKNDNAETLIYRLIKGTGTKGMNSIPMIRDFYYRPLINFSRAEIEQYLEKNNIEFKIDSSNKNTKYKRNLIREEILPLMEKINPNVINSIATFIKINEMNQKIIDTTIAAAMEKITAPKETDIIEEDNAFLRDKFLSLEENIQYEIINRKFMGILKNRDFKNTKKIINFIKENKSSKLSLNNELFLKIYDNKIYIIKNIDKKINKEIPLKRGLNEFLGYKLIIEKSPLPNKFPKNEDNIQYLKLDLNLNYLLRARKEGDIIQPFGSKTPQKLKTFFIKRKIPAEFRDKIPMIAIDNEILFIPNIMTSEKLRTDKNNTDCYKITITKE